MGCDKPPPGACRWWGLIRAIAHTAKVSPHAPSLHAALADHVEIRRIQEQHVKCLRADARVEVAAKAHAVEPRFRFRTARFVDFRAVGHGVHIGCKSFQCQSAATAWVEQIHAGFRKFQRVPHQLHMSEVGGIIAHFDVVHEMTDEGRVDRFGVGDVLPQH